MLDRIKEISAVPLQKVMKDGEKTFQAKLIKEKIIKALDYTTLRNNFYHRYFAEIGIKTCVYCNSQFTLSVKKTGNFSGLFDVDHYNSKHRYPWMSICLFNLYPACAPCNRRKSFNDVAFSLYVDNPPKNAGFLFKIDPYAKAKFLISKDPGDLLCVFDEGVPPSGKKKIQ